MKIIARVLENVQNAESILNSTEAELEKLSSEILKDNLTQKQASEIVLVLSERIAAACDELRELLGKKRVQTIKVK